MEIMDASIVGLITSAVCIFLLWKFLSCAVFPLLGNIIPFFLLIIDHGTKKSYPLSEDTIFLLQDSTTFYFVNNFIQPRALPFILGNIFT